MNSNPDDKRPVDGASPEEERSRLACRAAEPAGDVELDPFDEIAAEFAERYRRGETPSPEEYVRRFPQMEAEIRELFPTIAAMERMKDSKQRAAPSPASHAKLDLEQLGDFRILGEIGRGGMGVVYEAEQVSLGRRVAVKVLPKQLLMDQRHLQRFQREAQTAAKLHHTNIVPVFGVGEQDGYHYIVMQVIHGVGLDEVLIALRRIVFGHSASTSRLTTSGSRASHADHNAQALLEGDFGRHVDVRYSHTGGLSRAVPPATLSPSAATLEMAVTQAASPATDPHAALSDHGVKSDASPDGGAGPDSGCDHDDMASAGDATASLAAAVIRTEYWRGIARIGAQVANALEYAHQQGTLHRDIKPANLLLDNKGIVWVADFGLAKLVEQDKISRTGDVVGTLSYMSPESFDGHVDARSDIYSLGVTLYEMLALRPAFEGRDRGKIIRRITQGELTRPRKINPRVPPDLETIVLKALAAEPADRYATAGELAEDLQRYLDDVPILARRASPPERLRRWCRRNPLVASLSASVLGLLLLITILSSVASVKRQFLLNLAESRALALDRANSDLNVSNQSLGIAKRVAEERAQLLVDALDDIYDGLIPNRLPATSDTNLSAADDALDEESSAGNSGTVLATPPPASAETAMLLETLLPIYDKLANETFDDPAIAASAAEKTSRVGDLYNRLGKFDEATEAFRRAILKFEALTKLNPRDANAWVGLAAAHNELGQAERWSTEGLTYRGEHESALNLLRNNWDLLKDKSRANYELARTLFLLAIWRRDAFDFGPGGGPGGPGMPGRRPFGERRGRGPDRGGLGGGDPEPGRGGSRGPQTNGPEPEGSEGRRLARGGDEVQPDRRPDGGTPPANSDSNPSPPPSDDFDPSQPPPPRDDGRPRRMAGGRIREFGRGMRRPGEFRLRAEPQQLNEAIEILERLVKRDPLPEYQYLLARCYLAAPSGPQPGGNHAKALEILGRLVHDHGNVADYKYEYALAQLRAIAFDGNEQSVDELSELSEQLRELTEQNATLERARVLVLVDTRLAELLERQSGEQPDDAELQQRTLDVHRQAMASRQHFLDKFHDQRMWDMVARADLQYIRFANAVGQPERAKQVARALRQRMAAAPELLTNVTDDERDETRRRFTLLAALAEAELAHADEQLHADEAAIAEYELALQQLFANWQESTTSTTPAAGAPRPFANRFETGFELARVTRDYATLLAKAKQVAQAARAYDDLLANMQLQMPSDPGHPARAFIGAIYADKGEMLQRVGETAQATDAFRASAASFAQFFVLDDQEGNRMARMMPPDLAQNYVRVLQELGDDATAAEVDQRYLQRRGPPPRP